MDHLEDACNEQQGAYEDDACDRESDDVDQAMMPSTSWTIPSATNQPQPVQGRGLRGGCQITHVADVNDGRVGLATVAPTALVNPRGTRMGQWMKTGHVQR